MSPNTTILVRVFCTRSHTSDNKLVSVDQNTTVFDHFQYWGEYQAELKDLLELKSCEYVTGIEILGNTPVIAIT